MNNEYFYSNLVSNLSDESVMFFATTMNKQLPFLFLKPEDIRTVDLIEMLMQKDKDMHKVYKVCSSAVELYELILVEYMNEYAVCKKGTRAEKYKLVAINRVALIDGKHKKGVTFSDLKDAVMVFVSIYRLLSKDGKDSKKHLAVSTEFMVNKEDAEVIKAFSNFTNRVPKTVFTELRKKKRVDCSLEEWEIRDFFVNVSMLLLIGLLQDCGEFEE